MSTAYCANFSCSEYPLCFNKTKEKQQPKPTLPPLYQNLVLQKLDFASTYLVEEVKRASQPPKPIEARISQQKLSSVSQGLLSTASLPPVYPSF